MHQMIRSRNFVLLLILISILAVACTSGAPEEATSVSQGESAAPEESVTSEDNAESDEAQEPEEVAESDEDVVSDESDAAEEVSEDESQTDEVADEPNGEASDESSEEASEEGGDDSTTAAGPTGELEFTWELENIGEGIKPALDIDSAGNAHIAYLTEEEMGAVFYATNSSGDFETETVASGYFYGPVDIALGPDDSPYIAYHDHQNPDMFDPNLGDEVVAIMGEGGWDLVTVEDTGHDGWDNSIVVDADGKWHTAAVDPSQFGSSAGVEYATNAGGDVSVSQIGSGPIVYEFATTINLGPDGLPGIAYYDDVAQVLKYAKFDGSEWAIETVDDNGDAGRYAHLIYDQSGNPHIAYFVFDGEETGTVRHAWWDGSTWQIEDVDRLEDLRKGRVGARKLTSLAVDEEGNLHIAYSDRSRVVYGQRDDDGWSVQDLPHNSDKFLGQLVELDLDADGNPHMTWFEVTVFAPVLTGDIIYASGS